MAYVEKPVKFGLNGEEPNFTTSCWLLARNKIKLAEIA